MSDTAIKVENLSKLYQLGSIGTGTLRNDLQRWWAYAKGKEDPFTKIGQVNERAKKAESDFVWALKDIDFEVKKGEVLGIIGRNGAGKSTLLKILSKITAPTSGKIMVNGRIASLLEVGTGFHPELTGRENIFMNGAILGMHKWEIQKKLDEIIDFSGVEAYIDTPVKRYSSGMYVRLAFAVAAFLEPEILIVDEVLAVGDAEFQTKCLGRMKDVSLNEGRTVLFVSHNMAAIQKLCDRGVLINNGVTELNGSIHEVVSKYLAKSFDRKKIDYENSKERKGNACLKITNLQLSQKGNQNTNKIESLNEVSFIVDYKINLEGNIKTSRMDIGINDAYGNRIVWFSTWCQDVTIREDKNRLVFVINNFNLSPGDYSCNVYCEINGDVADWLENVLPFSIVDKNYYKTGKIIPAGQGSILFDYKVINS